jgi:serpin B
MQLIKNEIVSEQQMIVDRFRKLSDFQKSNNVIFDKLNKILCKNKTSIFSPYSISYIMSIINGGTDKKTKFELDKIMECSNDKLSYYKDMILTERNLSCKEFKTTNCIFIDKDYQILPNYLKFVKTCNSLIEKLDFSGNTDASCSVINKFIETKTNGLIKNVIDNLSTATGCVLINCIYFKSYWENQFKKINTLESLFTTFEDNKLNIDFMNQKSSFKYFEDKMIQFIELPYEKSEFVMNIILPTDKKCDLNQLNFFEASVLNKILVNSQFETVKLSLPKFNSRSKFELTKAFKMLGLKDLFDKNNCDLSKLSNKNLFVSQIIHEAIMIVDEEGTEAASTTAVDMVFENCSIPKELDYKIFNADHMFQYCIRHKSSGTILFSGIFNG